jgi:hypothetical protein
LSISGDLAARGPSRIAQASGANPGGLPDRETINILISQRDLKLASCIERAL